jgi:hypothetical protein
MSRWKSPLETMRAMPAALATLDECEKGCLSMSRPGAIRNRHLGSRSQLHSSDSTRVGEGTRRSMLESRQEPSGKVPSLQDPTLAFATASRVRPSQ